MREIRFRTWAKKQNEMITEPNIAVLCLLNQDEYSNFIVMQFTGLKDKNGKEIYEGDVVRQVHFTGKDGKQYFLYHTIEWSPKFLGWWMRNIHAKNDNDGCIQLFVHQYPLEVIGNIYQNPKLLEAK